MKNLIIYAHPNETSFNESIKQCALTSLQKNGEVRLRDLYANQFNPILKNDYYNSFAPTDMPDELIAEQAEITWADNLVFIFPTWWAGMPAILKGYFDRVFTNGFAFRMSDNKMEGLLKNKKAVILQTTGLSAESMKPNQLVTSMKTILTVGIFDPCGIEILTHKFLYSVPYIDNEARREMLMEVEDVLAIF
ncbi:NAD(P)H-dependent oxidoreductase [Metabacillus arenae]|uniref:NAD(P)H-dependent oxidoreductase n=1 Tax=Metabacillus arenae TaxID=2771434 RepID=A0A926NQY2_9BACI|nr:NAD(P)H-dependent oxidoreductase [Metabacillus arenae]MBD1382296.1 NAD(P)H-dependent oxidoreductase [Metabacillus arenae]